MISRFERESLAGFINPQAYLRSDGVELLSTSGNIVLVPYKEVKVVYFVRDLDAGEPPREKLLFGSRPKSAGLWVRMNFRDGECMDGLLPNDLFQIQAEPRGFMLVPPDSASNAQRMFVPREALLAIQVAGVVGSPVRRAKAAPKGQLKMFE